jgi:diguanylate cyclase (GGDEF)-like protein
VPLGVIVRARDAPRNELAWTMAHMEQLTRGSFYQRFLEAHDDHLRVYFARRDKAAALDGYHDSAIGVGTGRSEWGGTPEAMRGIICRDIDSFRDSIDYTVRDRRFLRVGDAAVVCQALLDLSLLADAHCMTLRDLRHTVVMVADADDKVRIAHIHVSFPTDVHGDEEPYPLKEIAEISAVVDELIANRTRDLTDAYRKLEHMAIHDRLTGLYNRIRLDEKLTAEIKRANRYRSLISVVMLDIDNFKAVNDDYGHLAGDKVLRQLAARITESLRETDLAGRWGGEEFLIILPETDQTQALQLAERLRETFAARPIAIDDADGGGVPRLLRLTISCGIAQHRVGDDLDSLFERVDGALYCAKRQGRNRSFVATADSEGAADC